MMEIVQEISNQFFLYIPVALVIVVATLVFTFGFKSAEQPPFDKLTNDDKKSAGKKKKIKEKKLPANGFISTGETKNEKPVSKEFKKSPAKEKTEPKQEKKDKKVEVKNKKNEDKSKNTDEAKTRKSSKKISEKPVDFDEGGWEMVPSKGDKKKKVEQSPAKKERKPKKTDKPDEKIEKVGTEKPTKGPRETKKETPDKHVKKNTPESEKVAIVEASPVIIEEKKEKEKNKKDKKPKKEPVQNLPPSAVAKVPVVQTKKPDEKQNIKEKGPILDELADVWTEAKQPKKSKKKARRDN